MTTTVAKVDQSQSLWTSDQIDLIRLMTAKDATENEFKIFLHQAARYGLDPLAKEIWCVKYGASKPVSIFVSHAGLIAIAHRTGQYGGLTSDEFYDEKGKLLGATATAWRKDSQHPTTAKVWLEEYQPDYAKQQGNQSNWAKMPRTMIKKVAEANVLRRAYNISGLYTSEEMDQAHGDAREINPEDAAPPQRPAAPPPKKVTPAPIDITPKSERPGPQCVACDKPIEGLKKDGTWRTAGEVAQSRIKNFGAALCTTCARKEQDKKPLTPEQAAVNLYRPEQPHNPRERLIADVMKTSRDLSELDNMHVAMQEVDFEGRSDALILQWQTDLSIRVDAAKRKTA